MSELYTIGYATKDLDVFLAQLDILNINAIADVRSVPYSKVFHNYHRENLARSLKARGIHYVYLGEELGPRSKDDAHYNNSGQVQFERLQGSALFQQGVQRLFTGLDKKLTISLLCAEKDPAICHRSLLIGQYLLAEHRLDIQHICHNGKIETQRDLERRLMTENDISADMLTPECDCLYLAWQTQNRRFAYRRPE
ncbi:MAG: DUF488 domain-containing protein [Zhongshania sp.]|uniref:DUF488 domain-containing protein n=1 Tax=Zhongshania sp. TaxID=1971902 RepID=UPI00261482FE|nr:DUF488 domain-containing protein [Zhongshania sp.]MDF1692680.1 DUF488 domain-containing protein [Zhongshania sp.]